MTHRTEYQSGECTTLALLLDLAMEQNMVAREAYKRIYGQEWSSLAPLGGYAKSHAPSTEAITIPR